MMLEHLGEAAAAKRLMAAIEKVTASGVHTPDLGGKATTADVTRAVCQAIREESPASVAAWIGPASRVGSTHGREP